MDTAVQQALARGGTIDITTTGRKSGQARRIEIAFSMLDGTVYITGTPGRPRSWYANLRANPAFTLHLKQDVVADLPARATPITDMERRRQILPPVVRGLNERYGLETQLPAADEWLLGSPLVAVSFDEA